MKKLLALILALALAFPLICCGEKSGSPGSGSIDVDLTEISKTVADSMLYNMLAAPNDYVGKTVKMRGFFSVYHDNNTGKDYFSCMVMDAAACCPQNFEFVLAGDKKYPDDYPEQGSEISVVGVFTAYEENGRIYYVLKDAALL